MKFFTFWSILMKHVMIKCLALAVLGSALGCNKAEEAPASPLTYSFQLLNEQGQEATVFPKGQNILFRFLLINPTNEVVVLNNPAFDEAEFLAVTRLTPGEGSGTVGKPYKNMFCEYVQAFRVPPHDTLELSISWVEAPNSTTRGPFCAHAPTTWLPVGRYRTSFPIALTLLRGEKTTVTAAQTFSKEFDVK